MLKTLDVVLILIMVAAAATTYSIKHHTDQKIEEVHRLEKEIKLEEDTIELLKADWALLTQPMRLHRLINFYAEEMQLVPTESTQLALPVELPMRRSELPIKEVAEGKSGGDAVAEAIKADNISTGSVKR
ncbi:hypothetical protein MRS76_17640 [Rhizobiaceae bacterium n13]|uniref:Cell division protein FtsL n=1 Tax=Ferirhizobium litorale TaxID=2927786 RepID=A0AAE3QFK6_9HYPH|nr:hypothetical protein [Fererhizobium litorale]MDI7863779.1 hypothetical protein [Fererhizobium litorale]MDI7924121.1 hypothetical protein [Fererhizobium litorale]